MSEATPELKQRLQEAFDEMYVERTFTDGDVAMFCGVTGGYNPYHQDEAFARESPYGRLTVPGLLTGSMLAHIGGILGFLATGMSFESFEYLAPVFVEDSVSCTVIVVEKNEAKRRVAASAGFFNQDGVEVLRARFSGFPGRIRLARSKGRRVLASPLSRLSI